MFENIKKGLSNRDFVIVKDKILFDKWLKGEITTKQCMEEFMLNNHYPYVLKDEEEFEKWLRSIGYIKEVYELEQGIYNK